MWHTLFTLEFVQEDLTFRIKGLYGTVTVSKNLPVNPLNQQSERDSLVPFLGHSASARENAFYHHRYAAAISACLSILASLYKHTVSVNATDDLKFKFFNVAQSIRTSVLL